MQFNGGGPGSDLQSEINITPLVDVVLVLLIIFMVVVPLLLKGYDVGIPRASAETAPAEADDVAGRPEHRVRRPARSSSRRRGTGSPPTVA